MNSGHTNLEILYEDNHCLAVVKPSRLLVAGDRTGDPNLLDLCKEYLKTKYQKPGNVFLGLVHRLDRPVSGIVLFARTSKSAARLSGQFRERTIGKRYLALVEGVPNRPMGTCRSWIVKDESTNLVRIVSERTPDAKEARLGWSVIESGKGAAILQIELETGRSHQIRAQLAGLGHPIRGDVKYGSRTGTAGIVALHAAELVFLHPTTHEEIRLSSPAPHSWRKLIHEQR